MPVLDTDAKTQLDEQVTAFGFFILVDILGDPLRITTTGKDVTFTGTGDADLDDDTFYAFDARAISVGDVGFSEDGSDTLQVELSGIAGIDDDLLAAINDSSLWRGRLVRLWLQVYDETGLVEKGGIVAYYTGYASRLSVKPGAKTQSIRLDVENYLVAFNEAPRRNYLNQKDYDAADDSAAATLAAANMSHGASSGTGLSGSSGGPSGSEGGYPGAIPHLPAPGSVAQ